MGFPSIAPSAKSALGSSLLGRLLGTAPTEDLDQPGEPLPPLKFALGHEPHTPRTGSPGFQDGHWVIARPKLATPIIYQHARSPANNQSSLGLGATTPPTTAGQTSTHRAGRSRRVPLTHHTALWGAVHDNDCQEKGGTDRGGFDGTISAWGEAAENHHGEQHHGSRRVDGLRRRDKGRYDEDNRENDTGDEQEERKSHELPPPPFAAEAEFPGVEACVNDLYFAVAHPRFDTDPICLRRQRENASAAAGALKNKLSMVNRCTNPAVRPTDKAGADRAEALEMGARMLMRSLGEGFPSSMTTRAVAALREVLTFQDVRTRAADATPSVVASLVGLLRREGSSGSGGRERSKRRPEEESSARRGRSRCEAQLPNKEENARLRGQRPLVKMIRKGKDPREEMCRRSCEAPLHAAACLRILALSDGLPQIMTSASAIPALMDGVKKGSPLMKSVCGGCLTSIALCEDESCSEMIDFGVLPLLLDLIRDGDRLLEQTAWGLLAAIMRVREAREAFVGAGGLNDVGDMLARKRSRRGSNRFLLAGQESAMRVLLSLCEEEEGEEEDDVAINGQGGESSLATAPTIQSVLLLGDDRARGAEKESEDDENGGGGGNIDTAGTRRGGKRRKMAKSREEGRASSEENPSVASGRTCSGSDWAGAHSGSSSISSSGSSSSSHRREGDAVSSHRVLTAVEDFVSRDSVFRSVLRQMRWGTIASMEKAAKILKLTWKACSRSQADSTMPAVLDMLASEVWILKSAAAKVILHVYVEDEQRLRCAVSGGVQVLVDTIRTRAPQMQAGTLSALLSLCEHPDVPAIVADVGGLGVLAEYLTTTRDMTTRYVVLATMKVILICERSAVEPHLPDMLVSEHVLGACDEIDEFVRVFVEKRKGSDYLRVGATNVCRFTATEIDGYKTTFKQLDKDASGALDTRELALLLKQLKVDSRKKTVKKVLVTVDKDHSGAIEFDEFLDIMWDIKHSRGLLLSRAGVFLEETLTAAQAALLSKRRQMAKIPSSPVRDRGDLRSCTTTTSATSISSVDERVSVEEGVDILEKQ